MVWVLTCFVLASRLSAESSWGQSITPAGAVVERLDGTTVVGEWMGMNGSDAVNMTCVEESVTVPTDDIRAIRFTKPVVAPALSGGAVFHLADGGRLRGELLDGAEDAVIARTALGDSVRLAWDRLAAIQLIDGTKFRRASAILQEALARRSPSQDELISRDEVEVKRLAGRLESLNAEGGSFHFSEESRAFQNDRLFAIVFAAGAKAAPTFPATFELADGSVFSGAMESADSAALRVVTSMGTTASIPVGQVAVIRFRSDRLAFISDLRPANERTEGIVHEPWRVQRDRSVSGGPLSIGGRVFARGLGVHSRTELSYSLNGAYDKFAATIGIDDAVRPLGSVVMRVEGDSKELFDSGDLRGTDAPRDIVVDVSGVKTLTLIVEYGEGLDLSDHADWGDARLIGAGRRKSATSAP